MKCPDCKREMPEAAAGGIDIEVPRELPEPGRRIVGRPTKAQVIASVCPKCGKVELRVLAPDWFAQ